MKQNILNHLILLVLWLCFFYGIFLSLAKLDAKEMILVLEQKEVDQFDFPTIVICPAGFGGYHDETFEDILKRNETIKIDWITQNEMNLMDEEFLREINKTTADVFSAVLMENPYSNNTLLCKMIKPPLPGEIGFNKNLILALDFASEFEKETFLIFMCYKDNFFPNTNSLFGCDFFMSRLLFSQDSEWVQSIGLYPKRTIKHNMDLPLFPCHNGGEHDQHDGLYSCFMMEFQRELQCRIPGSVVAPENLSLCSTEEDFLRYKKLSGEFKNAKEQDVFKKTGCKPDCSTEHLKIEDRWNFQTEKAKLPWLQLSQQANVVFYLEASDVKVTHESQVRLYTMSNFIADMGGYLGLLLGMSVYSFFQMGHKMVTKYRMIRNQCKECKFEKAGKDKAEKKKPMEKSQNSQF